jgi:Immunity protein 53
MDDLTWLTRWYAKHCNGEWEHQYGVKIDTLDNPGWMLKINLEETELENRPFDCQQSGEASEEYDPNQVASWWLCRVEKKQFVAYCGAHDLHAVISVFREWAEGAIDTQI